MEEKQFKGFEDLKVMEDDGITFWAFKGENTWSRDIVELWKWIGIAREKQRGKKQWVDVKFTAEDFED